MLRFVAEQKKRRLPASLALFLCLAVSACDGAGSPAGSASTAVAQCAADPATLRKAAVEHVYDGDTLRLRGGERVRLVGVNTPERGRDGAADEPFAEEARRTLQDLTRNGEVWLADAAQARDRHGRLLAYTFDAQGNSLSAQLLAQGMGFHVAIAPNTAYADCLAVAESGARAARRGVWGEPFYAPVRMADLGPGDGGFKRVRDVVTRVSFKDNGWWVQLGGKLGVKIAEPNQAAFKRSELRRLEGREVEVRGWLVPRDGGWWMLTLGHPAMLEMNPS
ncbi:thermonuclease family protein [Halioglobus sp. HI00S01]|uniref:thermonuclease family protein n=1 Tax=Halioglobus sp. HI00S01 TaxID=1822214 RepID=UPI0018D2EBF6|nr:thermonuclease family protein [Halioglobus sp. HI00S01]